MPLSTASKLDKNHANRFVELDFLRGIAILWMAIDHTYAFMGFHAELETPGYQEITYPTLLHFISRLFSHPAATTFIFLAGANIIFASKNRIVKGLSEFEITRFFILRGLLLILIQFTIVNLVWNRSVDIFFGVLASIGVIFIILSVYRLLNPKLLLLTCLSVALINQLSLSKIFSGDLFESNFMLGILILGNPKSSYYIVYYPILAWLPVAILGCYFAISLRKDKIQTFRKIGFFGFTCLLIFTLLRFIDGFGNLRHWDSSNWLQFFALCKYPPSLEFLMLTLGMMSVALFLAYKFRTFLLIDFLPIRSIIMLGRVPLFFYVVHLIIYKLLSLIYAGSGLPVNIYYGLITWLIGVLFLTPLCYGYSLLKIRFLEVLQWF